MRTGTGHVVGSHAPELVTRHEAVVVPSLAARNAAITPAAGTDYYDLQLFG